MDLRNMNVNFYKYEDEDKSISKKCLLSQFKGYYFNLFKRGGNISL